MYNDDGLTDALLAAFKAVGAKAEETPEEAAIIRMERVLLNFIVDVYLLSYLI